MFDNMSKARKHLVMAMMLGDVFEKSRGIVINKETKIMIGEEEFHYEDFDGKDFRLKQGDITQFGADEDSMRNFEVLDTDIHNNTIKLKEVSFFRAKVGGGRGMGTFCVAAEDRSSAFKIAKEYCKDRGYERIISMNPSKFFEPFER